MLLYVHFLSLSACALKTQFRRKPLARTKRRTRAKRKLNSAVVGVSKSHVFDSEIFALALPTLGAVLIDPCLSLVDTGYVGRLGALSLAAVGPCAAAFNFVFVTARWAPQRQSDYLMRFFNMLDGLGNVAR